MHDQYDSALVALLAGQHDGGPSAGPAHYDGIITKLVQGPPVALRCEQSATLRKGRPRLRHCGQQSERVKQTEMEAKKDSKVHWTYQCTHREGE